jgi:CRP/FNR family transcriptional regulator
MEFSQYFTVWNKLNPSQQKLIEASLIHRTEPKGTIIHNGSADCAGLILIRSGQLRAYILSDEGREVTIYRLFDWDICLFSASCVLNSVQFEIIIQAEKETEFWVIPPMVFKKLMEESAPMANYVNDIMGSRLSEVMWLVEQIMWKSLDKRLATFLLEEAVIEGTQELKITHENIANHLGTHREVVTRMLRYFQNEGMVKLSRGAVTLTDEEKLEALRED